MDATVLAKAKSWAENAYFDDNFRKEIQTLIDENQTEELGDRFYKNLEFGTGGLRGILGAGSNRVNIYTVRRATQGLATYMNQNISGDKAVVIACDNRRFSDTFVQESASVLAGNGIKVHVFPSLRPTPMLSFAVRELKATAGIVITASHNPPEYNGYKVSWDDGCQVTPPHDKGIIDCVNSIEDFAATVKTIDYEEGIQNGMINVIPDSLDQTYYEKVVALGLGSEEVNKELGVVFTPLHGTGNIPVREALKRRGFTKVTVVPEQELPDPDFPTVKSPNPEEESALALAIKTATDQDDLILATDPDADRVGAMVRVGDTWKKLNGNQIGQLLLSFYLDNLKAQGKLPTDGVFITTIVTSELGRKIAESYGLSAKETLTGFKYIGQIMREMEENKSGTYVFGCEESHGYLFGDFVRDKDAVSACMILSELAAEYKHKGMSLFDKLDEIHNQFGYHEDSLINKVIKGQSGALQIQKIMNMLRETPPKAFGNTKVISYRDYQEKKIVDVQTGEVLGETTLDTSNVMAFYLDDGSRITARPSGTEPKIKFYFNLCGKDQATLQENRSVYEKELLAMIDSVK